MNIKKSVTNFAASLTLLYFSGCMPAPEQTEHVAPEPVKITSTIPYSINTGRVSGAYTHRMLIDLAKFGVDLENCDLTQIMQQYIPGKTAIGDEIHPVSPEITDSVIVNIISNTYETSIPSPLKRTYKFGVSGTQLTNGQRMYFGATRNVEAEATFTCPIPDNALTAFRSRK